MEVMMFKGIEDRSYKSSCSESSARPAATKTPPKLSAEENIIVNPRPTHFS
jgi:hypothetical protein